MGTTNRFFLLIALLGIGISVASQTILSRFPLNHLLSKAVLEMPKRDHLSRESEDFAVPLERLAGVWVSKVLLNDFHEARLIVDTGATFTTISEDLAFNAGIQKDPATTSIDLYTAGGKVQAEVGLIRIIRVGDADRENVRVVVHTIPDLPDGIDGLLGLSFFDQFLVRLDHSKGQLHLSPKS